MNRRGGIWGVAFLGILLGSPAASGTPSGDEIGYRKHIRPILQKYCSDCHGTDVSTAKLDLSIYGEERAVFGAWSKWEGIVRRVREGGETLDV